MSSRPLASVPGQEKRIDRLHYRCPLRRSANILCNWIREEFFPVAKDPYWMTARTKIAQGVEGKVELTNRL